MSSGLPIVSETKSCPKCGSKNLEGQWQPANTTFTAEVVYIRCKFCGHDWYTLPLDAETKGRKSYRAGDSIEDFDKGWALVIGYGNSVSHYWRTVTDFEVHSRCGLRGWRVCGGHRSETNMLEPGSFPRCKTCEKLLEVDKRKEKQP